MQVGVQLDGPGNVFIKVEMCHGKAMVDCGRVSQGLQQGSRVGQYVT